MIYIARKYKQVHRKELTFDLKDWEKIERRTEACHTDTTKYLRRMVLEKQPIFYDFSELTPMVNGMRIISGNINQIAKAFVKKNFGDDVQAVIATHVDKSHLHSHMIINAYSLSGKRYFANRQTLRQARQNSDGVCKAFGLEINPNLTGKGRSINYGEWLQRVRARIPLRLM